MNENSKEISQKRKEISLAEIVEMVKVYWSYLLSKWILICVFGFSGAVLGLVASFLIKPKYSAHLSFALVEKTSGGGGLADLASSFGFSGLGGGSGSAFSGDNLLEIIQSRYAIEKTLLTPVFYNGKQKNLVEVYIDFSNYREKWLKQKNKKDLQNLCYPIGQSRITFNRTQDSVLNSFYEDFSNSKKLSVARKDKKVSIVNVDFTSENEAFAKLFTENLIEQTYRFYKETKTSQSRSNIEKMQHTADSIKGLYEMALYKSAGIAQVNVNLALQYASVSREKHENDAILYSRVYAEVLKNLETLKLDMARETPIIQMIDNPCFPLKKTKLGMVKGIVLGGFLSGFIIVFFLILKMYLKNLFRMNS